MAKEASRGSFLSATFSLLPCVAPAEFDADFVIERFAGVQAEGVRGRVKRPACGGFEFDGAADASVDYNGTEVVVRKSGGGT